MRADSMVHNSSNRKPLLLAAWNHAEKSTAPRLFASAFRSHTSSTSAAWRASASAAPGARSTPRRKGRSAYLGETAFRFTNGKNPYLLRDVLLHLTNANNVAMPNLLLNDLNRYTANTPL